MFPCLVAYCMSQLSCRPCILHDCYHFVSLRCEYSPRWFLLKHPQCMSCPQGDRPSSALIQSHARVSRLSLLYVVTWAFNDTGANWRDADYCCSEGSLTHIMAFTRHSKLRDAWLSPGESERSGGYGMARIWIPNILWETAIEVADIWLKSKVKSKAIPVTGLGGL
jgi:hypothetical protein